MFYHEKLKVYEKALIFAAQTAVWVNAWDKKHAVVDQMNRAVESILVNLAEAARERREGSRLQNADYAIGSTLECAGCIDIAQIKELLKPEECRVEKEGLCEITKMLIGLRKSWANSKCCEDPAPYSTKGKRTVSQPLFHHEGLEVYRTALNFMEWFVSEPTASGLTNRLFRQLDEAGTSIVLNIAEGNGWYAELDHHRFLQIAQAAAVKASVYPDLAVKRELLRETEAAAGKEISRKIGVLASGF